MKRRLKEFGYQLFLCSMFCLFLSCIMGGLYLICQIPAVDRFAEASRQDSAEKMATIFYPGDTVSVDGLAGVVNRECWMTWNNYAVRLGNGEITYVRGENLQRRF